MFGNTFSIDFYFILVYTLYNNIFSIIYLEVIKMIKIYEKDIHMLTDTSHINPLTVGLTHLDTFISTETAQPDGRFSPLDLNPDFQRGHVWNEQQQIAYVEFVLRGGLQQVIYFNDNQRHSQFKHHYYIVDGLQRLTALHRFVKGEIKALGAYYHEFDKGYLRSIRIPIATNDLATRKQVIQWYLDLNSGGTIHTKEELDRVHNLLLLEN